MRRPHSAAAGAIVLMAALPAVAPAAQSTDPGADSPAGAIYQIPLDTGRRDAAPLPRKQGDRGGGGGRETGQSGRVAAVPTPTPVTPAPAPRPAPRGTARRPGRRPRPDPAARRVVVAAPTAIHSENGFGSSSGVPGLDAAVPAAADGKGGGGSTVPAFGLVGLVIGLAGWLGSAAAGAARR